MGSLHHDLEHGWTTSTRLPPTPPTTTSQLAGSQAVSVSVGSVTHFGVTGPSTVATSTGFSITVSALDAGNNIVTGYVGTVHFSSTDGSASLPSNYTFASGDHGVHVFTGLTLATTPSQTVTATDSATGTITGSATIGVGTATPVATHFTVTASPSVVTAGNSVLVTVFAKDASGNLVSDYHGTVNFSSSDAQAAAFLPAAATLVGGIGKFVVPLRAEAAGRPLRRPIPSPAASPARIARRSRSTPGRRPTSLSAAWERSKP